LPCVESCVNYVGTIAIHFKSLSQCTDVQSSMSRELWFPWVARKGSTRGAKYVPRQMQQACQRHTVLGVLTSHSSDLSGRYVWHDTIPSIERICVFCIDLWQIWQKHVKSKSAIAGRCFFNYSHLS